MSRVLLCVGGVFLSLSLSLLGLVLWVADQVPSMLWLLLSLFLLLFL